MPISAPMPRPLDTTPLTMPASAPLVGSSPRDLNRTLTEPTYPTAKPLPPLEGVRRLAASPQSLREAILLNEILSLPLALRGRSPSQPRA